MKLFKYLVICFIVFVVAFSLEFKFGFFRELSLAIVENSFSSTITFISIGSVHGFTFILSSALLFAFIITLPLADYLFQRYSIDRKNISLKTSWGRSLSAWSVFVMGVTAAYGWIYFMFNLAIDVTNDPNATIVLPQLMSYLVGKQWLFGLLAWGLWMLIYKKWFSNARTP